MFVIIIRVLICRRFSFGASHSSVSAHLSAPCNRFTISRPRAGGQEVKHLPDRSPSLVGTSIKIDEKLAVSVVLSCLFFSSSNYQRPFKKEIKEKVPANTRTLPTNTDQKKKTTTTTMNIYDFSCDDDDDDVESDILQYLYVDAQMYVCVKDSEPNLVTIARVRSLFNYPRGTAMTDRKK